MIPMSAFDGLLKNLLNRDTNEHYEPLGALAAKDLAEWTDIQACVDRLVLDMKEVEARKELFWTRLRRSQNLNRESLRIEDGIVYGCVETPKERPRVPELPDLPEGVE